MFFFQNTRMDLNTDWILTRVVFFKHRFQNLFYLRFNIDHTCVRIDWSYLQCLKILKREFIYSTYISDSASIFFLSAHEKEHQAQKVHDWLMDDSVLSFYGASLDYQLLAFRKYLPLSIDDPRKNLLSPSWLIFFELVEVDKLLNYNFFFTAKHFFFLQFTIYNVS